MDKQFYDFEVNSLKGFPEGEVIPESIRWQNPQEYHITRNDNGDGRVTWDIDVTLSNENLDGTNLTSQSYKDYLPDAFSPKAVTNLNVRGANMMAQYDYSEYYNLRALTLEVTPTSTTPNYIALNLSNCPSLEKLHIDASLNAFAGQDIILPESIKEVEVHNPDTDETYTLPANIFTNNHDGVSTGRRIEYAQKMKEHNIPFTPYNTAMIMQAAHDGTNAVTNRLANYEAFGFLDVTGMVDQEKRQNVREAFIKLFGLAPKISDSIAAMAQKSNYNIPTDRIVESFDRKRTAGYLRNGVPHAVGSILMSTLSKNDYDKAIKSPYYAEIAQLCGEYWKNNKDNKYLNIADYAINHPKAPQNIVDDLIKYSSVIYLNKGATSKQAQAELSRASSFSEIARIEQKYGKKGFRFSDCNFDLKFHDTEMGTLRASIMRPGDSRMANLGYDTHCCQHLGGAGETAMMYGLVADKAGFWVVEDVNTNKIFAQAEIWELDDKTLVFDNIEFANDRDISGFLPIIGKWAKESEYENIVMGNGYNNVKKNTLEQRPGVEPPVTDKVFDIVGANIYTDASHGVSVIKDEGEVSDFFNENAPLFEDRPADDGHGHENGLSASEIFLARYSHLEIMDHTKELYNELDFDQDEYDVETQFEEVKSNLIDRLVDDMSQEDLIAGLVEDGGAGMEFNNVINYAAARQLLDNLDYQDVAVNAIYDAFSERYDTDSVSKAVLDAIEEKYDGGIDTDESADDILDEILDELSENGSDISKEELLKAGDELVKIAELKRVCDLSIETFDRPINEVIEENIEYTTEMIYNSDLAGFVRANYDYVEDIAHEEGFDIEQLTGDAYQNARENIQGDFDLAKNLMISAFGLMKAEEMYNTGHPFVSENDFSSLDDLNEMRILENTRNNFVADLLNIPCFDIRINGDPVIECFEGFEPSALEDVTVTADFYASSGVKLTTSVNYAFGSDIQDLRAQLAANFINMSPESIAAELAVPESERESFITDIQESLDKLEHTYRFDIPKGLLNKYKKPEKSLELLSVQQLIDEKFLSAGKSIEDAKEFIGSRIPGDKFSIDELGEFRFSSGENEEALASAILCKDAKTRLFVDMDGTLAIFNPVSTLEDLYEPGYFENLKPQWNVVEAVQNIRSNNPDIDIYVLSAVLSDSSTAQAEKDAWLDEFLPEIDKEHRIFCPCGEDKGAYIPGGLHKTDFLLDDYTANLDLWDPPARGIKLLNGINHTKGSWTKEKLSFERSGADLADRITGIMTQGEHVQDTNLRLDPQAKMTGDVLPAEIFDKETASFSFINPENGNKNYLNISLSPSGWDYMFFDKDYARQETGVHSNVANMKDTLRDVLKERGVALNDLSVYDETVLTERVLQQEQKNEKGHKPTDYAKQQLLCDNRRSRADE